MSGSRDAGTKIDQPSDQEGQGPDPKVAQEAAEAKAEEANAKADAPAKPKPKRKPAVKKSEGTASAETGVDKAVAEAALSEGSTEAPAAPKPKRTRKPKAEAAPPVEEPKAETPPTPTPAPKARRRNGKQADSRVTVRAQAKYVRTSARKARLVAEHVRGKDVEQARAILAMASRAVAEDWRKLLESAVANAEHNHDLVGDDLRVLTATADEGPTLKRFRPRAMGRASRIRKRTSHLTITLTPKE